jgi:protein-disulfide isomerase
MSSRIEKKAAARAARLAAEAEARRRAALRRLLIRLGTVSALALIAVVGAALVGHRGEGEASPRARAAAASALFAGIPQNGILLGSPQAPVTLVEFADLQCPYCAIYSRDVLPTVVERYVRTGRLRLELRLRTFLGQDSVWGAQLAAAAARQDRMWPFVELFYANQGEENSGYATEDFLRGLAQATPGLDVDRALRERGHPQTQRSLDAAEALAARLGSQSTPDFFLRGEQGLKQLAVTELTPEAFTAALDAELATP